MKKLITSIFFFASALASEPIAKAYLVKGSPIIRRDLKLDTLKEGADLYLNDNIKTDSNSSCFAFTISGNKSIEIKSNSNIRIRKNTFTTSNLTLSVGSEKLFPINGKVFTIRTPTAVAGVISLSSQPTSSSNTRRLSREH